MNRLILIGNGFDLAHGLKTSYHDFILDYLKGCIIQTLSPNRVYKDNLIVLTNINNRFTKENISDCNSIKELMSYNDMHFELKYESKFCESIFNNLIIYNWSDIENLYYQELIRNYINYNKHKNENSSFYKDGSLKKNINKLNGELNLIKMKLEEYIEKIYPKYIGEINELKKVIHNDLDPFVYKDAVSVSGRYLFLNFNYTSTPNQYSNTFDKIINIHGELNNNNNPIIFGYGDEVDRNYKEIQDINENEFFKHIKSFDYFKTSNYHDLLDFIDFGIFEIYIMGHSCGLSDRTMLSTIFEHTNCESIVIFYNPHDKNDFRNKTYEISRHFNDKAAMRKKIVPFPQSIPMPQYND